jgi:hypothetical protein
MSVLEEDTGFSLRIDFIELDFFCSFLGSFLGILSWREC